MNLRRLTSLLALSTPLALQTGCGPCEDGIEGNLCWHPAADSQSTSSSTTDATDSTETNETTTTVTSETTGPSGTETMTTTGGPACNMDGNCDPGESPLNCAEDCINCGNGTLEDGEVCDQGPNNSPDNAYHDGAPADAPCNSSCTGKVPYCGDGVCEPGEENTISCPADSCVAACGNGAVEANEVCDDGNLANNDACLDTCQPASCGDGFVQDGVEACDDANPVETDACLGTCEAAMCGDGLVWTGQEDCDDANTDETDDCDTMCKTVVHRKVFVSSLPTNGAILGLPVADKTCQTLANSAGLIGNFQAWLSDGVTGPVDRFDKDFKGVYELVDGTEVAHGWADLTDGMLSHAINLNEKQALSNKSVWTNTNPMGQPLGTDHCVNWTSEEGGDFGLYGKSAATGVTWTQADAPNKIPCDTELYIYCFEDPK